MREKNYEMSKDLVKEFRLWTKVSIVKNPVQDTKKFILYCKFLNLTKLIFGEDNFKADNPNTELKVHVINVRVRDVILNSKEDGEKMKALAYIMENADFFSMSAAGNGETVMIDYSVDGVYHEK